MSNDVKIPGIVNVTGQRDLPASGFSSWLSEIRSALASEGGVDVPCGDCAACCKSSYFIHVGPEETETLARIPKELLFAAPSQAEGKLLMGYDEKGRCPMLIDDKCSIYENRPLTCRSYDCRIFPAAGIDVGETDKVLLSQRAQRWEFSFPTGRDRTQHAAVRDTATFLRDHPECFPKGVPNNPTQLAILAIKAYDVFVGYQDDRSRDRQKPSDLDIVNAIKTAILQFEDSRGGSKQAQ